MKLSLIGFALFFSCSLHAELDVIQDGLNALSTNSVSNKEGPKAKCFCEDEIIALDQQSFENISANISDKLTKSRAISPFMSTCFESMKRNAPKNFQEAIRFGLNAHLTSKIDNHYSVLGVYGVDKATSKVSLTSAPMCTDFDSYFVAGRDSTKQKIAYKFKETQMKFARGYNTLRTDLDDAVKLKLPSEEITKKRQRLEKFFYSFMASLAEHESLGDPNVSSSQNAATAVNTTLGVANYSRPNDVKFYSDRWQSDPNSKFNIGLFQFSPNRNGNIHPCVESWNKIYGKYYSQCRINLNNNADAVKLIGASDQIFNAFCGSSKILQSKMVQINTNEYEAGSSKRRRTPKQNAFEGEDSMQLKSSDRRCWLPFSYSKHTYNHFGTLGHSVYLNSNGQQVGGDQVQANLSNVTETNTTQVIDEMFQSLEK